MGVSKEIDLKYKELNKNMIILIENPNEIANYTYMRLRKGKNEINNIRVTLDNINQGNKIDENKNIKRIKEILHQLENQNEENNKCITKMNLEELFNIKQNKLIKQAKLEPQNY